MEITHHDERVWPVKIDASGRGLLPARLRDAINAPLGATLLWVKDDDGLHLTSFEDSLADLQQYYQGLAPSDRSLTDELLIERRKDAARD